MLKCHPVRFVYGLGNLFLGRVGGVTLKIFRCLKLVINVQRVSVVDAG